MKVLSLVVDGLERAREDGLVPWVFQQDADIICLQDTQVL
jgi:exonuclease III